MEFSLCACTDRLRALWYRSSGWSVEDDEAKSPESQCGGQRHANDVG